MTYVYNTSLCTILTASEAVYTQPCTTHAPPKAFYVIPKGPLRPLWRLALEIRKKCPLHVIVKHYDYMLQIRNSFSSSPDYYGALQASLLLTRKDLVHSCNKVLIRDRTDRYRYDYPESFGYPIRH